LFPLGFKIGNYASLQILNIIHAKVKGKVVPEHHAMKAYWGSGGIAPLIL
jgi:hypothetical protein